MEIFQMENRIAKLKNRKEKLTEKKEMLEENSEKMEKTIKINNDILSKSSEVTLCMINIIKEEIEKAVDLDDIQLLGERFKKVKTEWQHDKYNYRQAVGCDIRNGALQDFDKKYIEIPIENFVSDKEILDDIKKMVNVVNEGMLLIDNIGYLELDITEENFKEEVNAFEKEVKEDTDKIVGAAVEIDYVTSATIPDVIYTIEEEVAGIDNELISLNNEIELCGQVDLFDQIDEL